MAETKQQGTAPEKKGLPTLAWVGIGCVGVAVLGVLLSMVFGVFVFRAAKEAVGDFTENPARAAAELAVRANPDLEIVESDDEATITLRNTRTGEVTTMNFEDIAEGKFVVKTDEGEYTADASEAVSGEGSSVTLTGPSGETRLGGSPLEIPDWVPHYPGATMLAGGYTSDTPQATVGMFQSKTNNTAQEVLNFYRVRLPNDGFEIRSQNIRALPQGAIASISASIASAGRTVSISLIEQGGETLINCNYNAKIE